MTQHYIFENKRNVYVGNLTLQTEFRCIKIEALSLKNVVVWDTFYKLLT